MKTGAVVVTYDPILDVFRSLLDNISSQVDYFFVIDNNSKNTLCLKKTCLPFSNIIFIENGENKGLGFSYNLALSLAEQRGIEWLLILDQDSICPRNLIQTFVSDISILDDARIGLICPNIFNRSNNTLQDGVSKSMHAVMNCISSGSFVNVVVARKVGAFNADFFMDYVDFDFSRKLRKNGFRQIMDPLLILNHDIGGSRTVLYFGLKTLVFDKPLFRYYYSFRNRYFFIRTEKNVFVRLKEWFWFFYSRSCYLHFYKGRKKTLRRVISIAIKDAKKGVLGVCSHDFSSF
jgi:rhamnosyltransferase